MDIEYKQLEEALLKELVLAQSFSTKKRFL